MSTAFGKNAPVKTCKIMDVNDKIIGIVGIFTIKENLDSPEVAKIEYFLKKNIEINILQQKYLKYY